MGRIVYETYNPEYLDIPYDTDYDFEGIDERYESYQEYEAYLPDKTQELKPLTKETIEACENASQIIEKTKNTTTNTNIKNATAWLLLYDEAVSTTQAENYNVSCTSLLKYKAQTYDDNHREKYSGEETALAAIDALKEFMTLPHKHTTLDDLCEIDEEFARTSLRAEKCGKLRDEPVWIGGKNLFDAEFVPPPADMLEEYMDDLIDFINTKQNMPAIAKAAIAQAQLVTIHPFSDGNGRTGRALSQRILMQEGVTDNIILPTTSAAVHNIDDFVQALTSIQQTTKTADPNEFVTYFAHCCEGAAYESSITENKIDNMFRNWAKIIPASDTTARKAMEEFAMCPVMTETMLSQAISKDSKSSISTLIDAGIIIPSISPAYNIPIYIAEQPLKILEDAQRMRSNPYTLSRTIASTLSEEAKIREKLEGPVPIKREATDKQELKKLIDDFMQDYKPENPNGDGEPKFSI